jgi:hypothetical protein
MTLSNKDVLQANETSGFYFFRAHQYYNLARLLINNFRLKLIESQGIGKLKFTIRCTLTEFRFFGGIFCSFLYYKIKWKDFYSAQCGWYYSNSNSVFFIMFSCDESGIFVQLFR